MGGAALASGAEFSACGGVTAERPRLPWRALQNAGSGPGRAGPRGPLLRLFFVAEAHSAVANGVPGVAPGWAAVGGFAGSRERQEFPRGTLYSHCLQEDRLHEQQLCMPVKFVGVKEVFNFLMHCLLKGSDLM